MSGDCTQHHAGVDAINKSLNGAVGSVRENRETRETVGVSNRAAVDCAEGTAGGRVKYDLAMLHHEATRKLKLFHEADGHRPTVDLKLPSACCYFAIRIDDAPQRRFE